MITCGLDASTKTVGWAFSQNNKILAAGFIDISKLSSNKEKILFVVNFLKEHSLINEAKIINLEAALSGFGGGATSQQVIIKLARFNAVLEYVLGEIFPHCKVNLVAAMQARKAILGKAFIKGTKAKDFVRQELEKLYGKDLNAFIKLNNKKGNWDKRNADTYDAIIMSLFY